MKLNSDLYLSGNQVKEVGFPKDANDVISRAYLESKIACWEGTRYYCLNAIDGDDNNLGYSDISSQEASKCAVRTVKKLTSIIPRIGSGASVEIAIASGAYDKFKFTSMDYDTVNILSSGWNILGKYYCLKTNQVGDMIKLGNQDGSNADLSKINLEQSRIRFNPNTITSSLRNFSCDLYSISEYSQIHLKELLKSRPCEEDSIFIEQPAAKFELFDISIFSYGKSKITGICGEKGIRINYPLNSPDISFCYGPGIIDT